MLLIIGMSGEYDQVVWHARCPKESFAIHAASNIKDNKTQGNGQLAQLEAELDADHKSVKIITIKVIGLFVFGERLDYLHLSLAGLINYLIAYGQFAKG